MHRLLIANRGEIARRIIRTARRLGIETVAVYSDADTDQLHVAEADISVRLPGLQPRETYLNAEAVIQAATKHKCNLLHPGYGFLSESAEFAQACTVAGIQFVGPEPAAMSLLGNKTNARRLAVSIGVPVVPGSTKPMRTLKDAEAVAIEIGYPILLKAAAGGGGKGMRVVRAHEELASAMSMAMGESLNAFGSDEIFVERFIDGPRHIEVQVVADSHGNVVVLGERECSIQRRHQKLIEESPSVAVSQELRNRMFRSSEELLRAANYTNAATIEFLLGEDGEFYFLEVNSRLQVEHPVTEMVTGLDIVEMQIQVALNVPLEITTDSVTRTGHAIECRICAEDVYENFIPSTGIIRDLHEPEAEHVRVESAMHQGMRVGLYYDPMLAKLIVWGPDRATAIDRMISALNEYYIAGVSTTIPFVRFVLGTEQFRSGSYNTKFVEENWSSSGTTLTDDMHMIIAASALQTDALHRSKLQVPDAVSSQMSTV